MNDKLSLHLTIVTQETKLLEKDVQLVTVPTTSGEITVLPNHIPLMSQLQTGELSFEESGHQESIVVSGGFINLSPDNNMIVMVDSATHERDISEQKAQAAIDQAHQTMQNSTDRQELLMAEASLKRAMLELRVAQKTKKAKI